MVLKYTRGQCVFHIANGASFDLESIQLRPYGMDEFLDNFLLPYIRYRVGRYHHNYKLIDWYNEGDNKNIEKKGKDMTPMGENA